MKRISFLRLVPQGKAVSNLKMLEMSPEDWVLFYSVILPFVSGDASGFGLQLPELRLGCPLHFPGILNGKKVPVCHAGSDTLLVTPTGDVFPCPAFKGKPEMKLGSVAVEPLSSILERAEEHLLFCFLKKTILEPHLIEECRHCEELLKCRGRCAAQRFHAYGSFGRGPDPLCEVLF